MEKEEFKDLSVRAKELQKFFEDVRVTFSRHTDGETDATLKSAVSQFKILNEELSRVADGEQEIEDAHLHEREIAEATAEKAIPVVEEIIEEEMRTVISEIDDMVE